VTRLLKSTTTFTFQFVETRTPTSGGLIASRAWDIVIEQNSLINLDNTYVATKTIAMS
jgi:hypothetical protein